jgi:short subunit fatty acids transporter
MLAVVTIEIPAWGAASLIDFLWTFSGIVGFLVAAWGLRGSVANMSNLAGQTFEDPIEREAAKVVTINYVLHDLLRTLTFVLVTIVGIIAMTQGPPEGSPTITTPVGLALTVLFFTIVVISGTHSALDQRQRATLDRMFNEERK